MRRTEAVVIGGGQAGLAMSRCLSDAGVDHVVLERGRVAERWRSERWDSLRLLTPNWQSRLPGFRYDGPDPDGYMTVPEVVDYLDRYARSFAAPVEEGTTVLAVEPAGAGYRVTTDRGAWEASSVVIATGHCDMPFVPAVGAEPAGRRRPGGAEPLPEPAPAPGGRRARRRRVGHRRPARGRDPRLGPAGDARGGPPHAAAAHLPGARHPLVARRDGRLRRDGRRRLRPRDLPRPAVAPARGPARPRHARPAHAPGARRPARRARRRGGRRAGRLRRRPRRPDGRGGRAARAPRPADRRVRRAHRPRRRRWGRPSPSSPSSGRRRPRRRSTSGPRASGPWSGPRASAASTRG